jgi:hypothetical protein
VKGDAQALAEFEVVRYKAIVKEKFQARIPKNRISTTTRDTSQIFASKRQLHVVQQSEWQRCLIQEINKRAPGGGKAVRYKQYLSQTLAAALTAPLSCLSFIKALRSLPFVPAIQLSSECNRP